jgi:hypothetical protein
MGVYRGGIAWKVCFASEEPMALAREATQTSGKVE